MGEVGIPQPEKRFKQYPFQFSGGMRQRIVIAIALAMEPEILICDEPTTALDVTIQAQILDLIKKLKKEKELTIIFITHDLGVVANMADRIAVMYAGKIVEYGDASDVFYVILALMFGWRFLKSMFGFASFGAIFSGNIVFGVVIMVVYFLLSIVLGLITLVLGIGRFIYLLVKKANQGLED